DAAERVTPDRDELLDGLEDLRARLRDLMLNRLDYAGQRVRDLAERRAFRLPLERVRELERRLDDWEERCGRAVRRRLERARQAVDATAARLETLSPLNVLGRGYSLTRREADGIVVRGPEQVQRGDRLVTVVQRGRIISRVEEAPENNAEC